MTDYDYDPTAAGAEYEPELVADEGHDCDDNELGLGRDATIEDLADKTLRGEFGVGEERRKALGDLYIPVLQRVREIRLSRIV